MVTHRNFYSITNDISYTNNATGVAENLTCPKCGKYKETSFHFLEECETYVTLVRDLPGHSHITERVEHSRLNRYSYLHKRVGLREEEKDVGSHRGGAVDMPGPKPDQESLWVC